MPPSMSPFFSTSSRPRAPEARWAMSPNEAPSRAEISAISSEIEFRATRAVGETTGGDDRNLEFPRRSRNQHQTGNVVLARMSGALESIDADGIDPERFGLQCVAHGDGLMHDLHPGGLE